jgi:simple sugar transport system permease protein
MSTAAAQSHAATATSGGNGVTGAPAPTGPGATSASADRSNTVPLWRRLIVRPELTAVVGTIVVFVFFAINAGANGFLTWAGTSSYLDVAATVGILAVPVTLLLISGQFDLSIGSQVGTAGIVVSYVVVVQGQSPWVGLLVGVAVAVVVGGINGILVAYTAIPSFLVTLATMYVLSGVTLAFIQNQTQQTSISGLNGAAGEGSLFMTLFSGTHWGVPVSVFWWVGVTALGVFVLAWTKFGNWVYVAGGNSEAGKRMGVPVRRVHLVLYIMVGIAAVIVALLMTTQVDQADVNRGVGMEFQAAVAAVIGGALITGGYGSPLGTLFGALLFGMVSQGFFYTDIASSLFTAFLGVMLLAAVSINHWLKIRSMSTRKKVTS